MRARDWDGPLGFLSDANEPTILDEIQYAPELLRYIKDRIDSDRTPGRWLLKRNGKLYGIEVTATKTPQPRHGEGIARWLDLVGPTATGVVACDLGRPMALRRGIRAVPWHLAW